MITTKNGLLYNDGREIDCHEADAEARAAGFQYAEQLVKHLKKEQEMSQDFLAVFDPIRAEIATFAKENALTQFQYETPKGNELARSWCYKLRLVKGTIAAAHKTAKAKALDVCQKLDALKREYTAEVDAMIEVHDAPLREIETRAARAEEEKRLAEEAEKARLEAERLAELERREAELRASEAKMRSDLVAFETKQREAKIKSDAEAAAQARIIREREDAARQHEEAIAFERRKAQVAQERAQREAAAAVKAAEDKARREREEAERVSAEARIAEVRKREQEAKAKAQAEAEEADRVANKKHRAKVEKESTDDLDKFCNALNDEAWRQEHFAPKIIEAIKAGKISHVSITY